MKCSRCDRPGRRWEAWGGSATVDCLCWRHGVVARLASASTYISLIWFSMFMGFGFGVYKLFTYLFF